MPAGFCSRQDWGLQMELNLAMRVHLTSEIVSLDCRRLSNIAILNRIVRISAFFSLSFSFLIYCEPTIFFIHLSDF